MIPQKLVTQYHIVNISVLGGLVVIKDQISIRIMVTNTSDIY